MERRFLPRLKHVGFRVRIFMNYIDCIVNESVQKCKDLWYRIMRNN